jgi:hypothetical protein
MGSILVHLTFFGFKHYFYAPLILNILYIFWTKLKFWGFTNHIGFIKPFALNTLVLNQDFQDSQD